MHQPAPTATPADRPAETVELLTRRPDDATPAGGGHACGCGHADEADPVLDVREIPHAFRHATVIAAVDTVGPGGSLVVVAPHRPLPLLAQIAERVPVDVAYLEEGPDAWRLRITRLDG